MAKFKFYFEWNFEPIIWQGNSDCCYCDAGECDTTEEGKFQIENWENRLQDDKKPESTRIHV